MRKTQRELIRELPPQRSPVQRRALCCGASAAYVFELPPSFLPRRFHRSKPYDNKLGDRSPNVPFERGGCKLGTSRARLPECLFALLTYMHFFLMDDNGLGCGRVALLFIGFVLLCLLTFIFFLFLFFVFSKQRVQGAVEHLRQFNQRRDVRLVFIILPFADGLERGMQVIRKLLLPNSFLISKRFDSSS